MRTVMVVLLLVIGIFGINSKSTESEWTQKKRYEATLVEKWEDWSTNSDGATRAPYKALFQVHYKGTNYFERVSLSAQNYAKAVPGMKWDYTTSLKDLGVPPTKEQARADSISLGWVLYLIVFMPIFAMGCFIQYVNSDRYYR